MPPPWSGDQPLDAFGLVNVPVRMFSAVSELDPAKYEDTYRPGRSDMSKEELIQALQRAAA